MKWSCYLICCCLGCPKAHAQQAPPDSAFYAQAVQHVRNAYKTAIGQNLQLYTGNEYNFSGHGATGFPFFEAAGLLPGTVYYNGKPYTDLMLHYDLTTDDLVINDYTQNYSIRLVPEKIDSFFIGQHKFVRLKPDTANSFAASGFYESLFEGRIVLLARREKKFQLSLNASDKSASYLSYNSYFVKKGEQFIPVHNKSTMLAALEDRTGTVKEFVKKNRLDFKKQRESALIQTAQNYSRLKN